jgi:glycosyltransferase involved in cell wall biosynthesis
MKVLFVNRRGVFSTEGGEQTQIHATAAALGSLGVGAEIVSDPPDDYARYDLVHFFGLDQDHIDKIRRARGVPRVLTPVFWDRYQQFGQEWDRQRRSRAARRIAKWRRQLRRRPERKARRTGRDQFLTKESAVPLERGDYNWALFQEVIDEIDLLLPNSEMEMDSVRRSFVFERPPRGAVVHNAIDPGAVERVSDFAERTMGEGRFILCSAGVDPRKNQFNLVRALVGVGLPIVLAGQVRDEVYAQAVRALARAHGVEVRFLGHLDAPDLHSLYARAAVHALPSYHETPGISNLEAIAHGCPNASTKIGGLEEYVGEYSLYCNPYSVSHIRRQVVRALEMPRNPEAAAFVRGRYTWENAARETKAAYDELLAGRGGAGTGSGGEAA